MKNETIGGCIHALEALLEKERSALLKGDLGQLTDILPEKQELIDALNEQEHSGPANLLTLNEKVKRNQLLLDGALEGIRGVAARMSALRRIRCSLETYGSDGRKKNIGVGPHRGVERRA